MTTFNDTPESLAGNRALMSAFVDLLYVRKDIRAAFESRVQEAYIQHNPAAADGREAAIAMLSSFFASVPTLSYDIKRVLVDGDLAMVHGHLRMHPADPGMAVVDIFRIEDGRIAEHWDVMQAVPESSANANTMF